jgi:hypothetical protein
MIEPVQYGRIRTEKINAPPSLGSIAVRPHVRRMCEPH